MNDAHFCGHTPFLWTVYVIYTHKKLDVVGKFPNLSIKTTFKKMTWKLCIHYYILFSSSAWSKMWFDTCITSLYTPGLKLLDTGKNICAKYRLDILHYEMDKHLIAMGMGCQSEWHYFLKWSIQLDFRSFKTACNFDDH